MKFPLTRSDVEMAAAAARYSPEVLREQLSQQTAFAVLTAEAVREAIAGEIR